MGITSRTQVMLNLGNAPVFILGQVVGPSLKFIIRLMTNQAVAYLTALLSVILSPVNIVRCVYNGNFVDLRFEQFFGKIVLGCIMQLGQLMKICLHSQKLLKPTLIIIIIHHLIWRFQI